MKLPTKKCKDTAIYCNKPYQMMAQDSNIFGYKSQVVPGKKLHLRYCQLLYRLFLIS
jgi:hypothetical protein